MAWSFDASETGESTKRPWVMAVGLKAWGCIFSQKNRGLSDESVFR